MVCYFSYFRSLVFLGFFSKSTRRKGVLFPILFFVSMLLMSNCYEQSAIAMSELANTPTVTLTGAENSRFAAASTNDSIEIDESVKVLVIHSYHSNLSWTRALKAGIDQGFGSNVTVYHEFLDAKRHPELLHQEAFLEYIKTKYEDTQLFMLMVTDAPGMTMVLANQKDYFPDLPVVFMGVNHVQEELLAHPLITGVFENHSNGETIIEASRHNQADSVIVISDSTSTGQGTLQSIQAVLSEYNNSLNVVVLEDLVTSDIAETLGDYPDHWPIFLAGQLREGAVDGSLTPFELESSLIREHVPNPIYVNNIIRVGEGAVGGKLLDGQYHAQQAVQLAQQIVDGTDVADVEPVLEAKNQWIFDAQVLEQVGIDANLLPADSVLMNVQPSFYRQYRYLVWGTLFVFSVGTVTITVLSYAIGKQKHAERLLRENEKQLESRVEERTVELSKTLEKLQKTQAQLIQTEKMSSLGQLVGGIAHELNNPLNFFMGNVRCIDTYMQDLFDLLRLYRKQPDQSEQIIQQSEDIDIGFIEKDTPKVLASMKEGANRIQNIVSGLQKFSRSDEQGVKSTDINHSLESTLDILYSQISSDIEIHKDYGKLPTVICNPGEINQVFLSILANAIEAMKSETTRPKQLFISTFSPIDEQPNEQAGEQSKKTVCVVIKDTGTGISEEIQSKVFDPFFTTKPVGAGTGLGLATAYQTIKQHHGTIQLHSDGKTGTEFTIELPVGNVMPAPSSAASQERFTACRDLSSLTLD